MRAHIIENGSVVNTIVVDSLDSMPGLVLATEGGIGWGYNNGVFTDPNAQDPTQQAANDLAEKWENLRDQRNKKLASSDWTQLADTGVNKAAWAAYRQSLRDLPSVITNIDNITWPDSP